MIGAIPIPRLRVNVERRVVAGVFAFVTLLGGGAIVQSHFATQWQARLVNPIPLTTTTTGG